MAGDDAKHGEAFGAPGIAGTWTSSDKDLVTTAIGGSSEVWLTLGHGIANEVYWPSTGQPQMRDLGFLVVAEGGWTEVKRAALYDLTTPAPAVLFPSVTHHGDGWRLRLEWTVDPDRNVVLLAYEIEGPVEAVYLLAAPHLGGGDHRNSAWVDSNRLHAVADGADLALCVACDPPFEKTSVGYVGFSDGWQDVTTNGRMSWSFNSASGGNVALTGSLPLGGGTVAIGFATTVDGATQLAGSSLAEGAASVQGRFVAGWQEFADGLDVAAIDDRWREMAEHSAAVLACHEDRTYPGAIVASLSVPWGNNRGDLGGYHLVWARDCVEVALARLALGERVAARRTLSWLCAAQQPDGHWTQNAFPDGRPFWTGIQLDEVALPIILAAALEVDVEDHQIKAMVHRAVGYVVEHGPASPQDRWEENAGVNAYTLAAVVSALLAATRWFGSADALYLRSLARYWNDRIEDWLYVVDGPFSADLPIDGYYVRLGRTDGVHDARGQIDVRNRDNVRLAGDQLVACDFLALVRFGLRNPHDQRIVDSVRLIDEVLAVDLPTGVAYRRYNGDGYGEHADGSPFDGTGIGRPWPLLAGERGHYAAQAGDSPDRYLDSMTAMTGRGRLLPEQVWDADPIPGRFLEPGHPTGSAMPLAWAHAEFVKLATFKRRGRPIECLTAVTDALADPDLGPWHWRIDLPLNDVPAGRRVLIDHHTPFVLTYNDNTTTSSPLGLGRHGVHLDRPIEPATFTLRDDGGETNTGQIRIRREDR